MLTVTKNLLPTVSKLFDDDWDSLLNWNNHRFNRNGSSLPPANIKETSDAFHVEMILPGMSKEDIKLEIDNNRITVKGEKRVTKEGQEKENYTHREFSYQSFERSFNLNNSMLDVDKIEAKYEDGMLMLTLPKREEAKEKPPRMIEIS